MVLQPFQSCTTNTICRNLMNPQYSLCHEIWMQESTREWPHQMCLDTQCHTRHEMVICEFCFGGEVGFCNKSKIKPSFDQELAHSSTNLAITGKSRHGLSRWNLSVLLLIQVVKSKYSRIFLRHITLSSSKHWRMIL